MDYVIETRTKFISKRTGQPVEIVSYFSHIIGLGQLGTANSCSNLAGAKRFDFKVEAQRIKRQRFGGRKDVKIVKVESLTP